MTSSPRSVVSAIVLAFSLTLQLCASIPIYGPTCPYSALDSGYVLWSSRSTWNTIGIPGINNMRGASITIPCGKKVILDVPNIVLNTLDIQGALKVLDDGDTVYSVTANRILVQGQFQIGTPTVPFRSKITFTLTNTDGKEYVITRPPMNRYDGQPSKSLGFKLFGVIGGRVQFYGIGNDVPSWVHLATTANPGATSIIVRGNPLKWPVGASIGISTTFRTDNGGSQNEEATIVAVRAVGTGRSEIVLSKALRYEHAGFSTVMAGYPGRVLEQYATVSLLSRNIVIRGTPEPFNGGHFIVSWTPAPQHIQGVEFVDMGQQGILGRYPLHLHMGLKTASVLAKNAIHHCKQRCVVLHGVHDVRITDNVCFKTFEVGYAIEDGLEVNNYFEHNLATGVTKPSRGIDTSKEVHKPALPIHAAGFWSTSAPNHFVNNYAAGVTMGFWFDMTNEVRGICVEVEGASSINPWERSLGTFRGNAANSVQSGFRDYPFHYPIVKDSVIDSFRCWRCSSNGIMFREVHGMLIKNAVLSEFQKGVNMISSSDITVADSFMAADPLSTGPPRCYGERPTNDFFYKFGVWINSNLPVSYGNGRGHTIINTAFVKFFPSACKGPAAAIGVLPLDPTVARDSDRIFPASTRASGIRLDASTSAFYFSPKNAPFYITPTITPYSYGIEVLDGSMVGQRGEVISEEYFTKLFLQNGRVPALPAGCSRSPKIDKGVICANACMRTILIRWAGAAPTNAVVATLRRKNDGAVAELRRYRDTSSGGSGKITTVVNLLTSSAYDLRRLVAAGAAPTITHVDTGGCLAKVSITVL